MTATTIDEMIAFARRTRADAQRNAAYQYRTNGNRKDVAAEHDAMCADGIVREIEKLREKETSDV